MMEDMLGSDDEDKHDAYLERMKREGQEAMSDDDDDEDSSEGTNDSVNYTYTQYVCIDIYFCHSLLLLTALITPCISL